MLQALGADGLRLTWDTVIRLRSMMKSATRDSIRCQIAFWLIVGGAPPAFAQGGTQPLVSGTVVTGECAGHGSEPGCVLPNLFGSTGLTLNSTGRFPHYAHFIGAAQTTLNQTLGTAIATQLAILPIISPASGFTYKYNSATGAFERSTTTFGPIYTERAETIGRGAVYFGVSYQRFRFDKLDGIDLRKVPAIFSHVPGTGPGGSMPTYEADVIQSTNDVSFHMDQTMFYGTVGLTDRVDLSVAVPVVSVRMGAGSDDTIIRVSGATFELTPGGPSFPNPHAFNAQGSTRNFYNAKGRASGIGDITFRAKANVLRSEAVRVALALDIRAPTGDARQLLGSGSTGIKPFLAISAGRRISPHVNLGYEWNSSSILAGNVTGSTISEDSTGTEVIQNGSATKAHVPSNFFFALGADVGVNKRLSLSFDYLGQTVFNAPRVFSSSYQTEDIPGGTGTLNLPDITGRKETMTLNSAAAGLKYNLFGGLLITADLLFRLDNRGLRQDVTPLIAISHAFGK
jgi:hypothetical protein